MVDDRQCGALFRRLATDTFIGSGSLIITGVNPFAAVLDAIENQVLKESSSGTQAQIRYKYLYHVNHVECYLPLEFKGVF